MSPGNEVFVGCCFKLQAIHEELLQPACKEGTGFSSIDDDLAFFLNLRARLANAFSKDGQQILCQADQRWIAGVNEVRLYRRAFEAEPN